MNNHVKIYLRHFKLGDQDLIYCEACQKGERVDGQNMDIHHINGRGKDKDVISNLMALCRRCHTKAHKMELTKEELQTIHNYKLSGRPTQFFN